jgi:hypothetical protein
MNLRRPLLLLLIICNTTTFAQTKARSQYISEYSQIAIDEMNRSGIPASITLAQGILESGNGKSELARKSNNHFGIKCHSSWKGARVYHDDDEQGECFRKYEEVRHSFEDHTDFLVRGSRYKFLFELEPGDYKGWAEGLKKAGYATSPDYAERLIKIIEDEMLYVFDGSNSKNLLGPDSNNTIANQGPVLDKKGRPIKNARQRFIIRRMIDEETRVPFVVLQEGERIEYVADSLNLPIAALLEFNDMTWETVLSAGDRIYIDIKKGRGLTKTTTVLESESLRDISQREQMKLSKIYKFNDFHVGYQPLVGDEIRSRPKGLVERLQRKKS